jgi:signal transduction histidine kinase
MRVTGTVVPLPPTAQLTIYRMVQESLTNTLKHADATRADVSLVYRDGTVELTVIDNGGGPAVTEDAGGDAARKAAGDGHGIAGMRERAAVFGGVVEAGPTPVGWRVRSTLHLAAAVDGVVA